MTPTRAAPLKVAIAGAGMIAWYHLEAWRKLGDRVRVVAVCDPDVARATARAKEFAIAKVYGDAEMLFAHQAIDALDVASPRETHAAWVDAAAARGIDVLCQKPLTPTLVESEALVRRTAGRVRLMAHENWRFRPWYRELHRWMGGGELGDVLLARMSMIGSGMLPDAAGRRPALERQPFMQHEPRLMLAEVLIHHLDVVRFLCGPLTVLSARTAHTLSDVTGETLAAVFLQAASGAPVEVAGTMAAPGYSARPPDRLEIVGSRASATFDDWTLTLHGPTPRSIAYDRDQGYQASFDGVIAHFVECLQSGAAFETDAEENLATLRIVEDAYAAAARPS
jgi:predicted dehydrogenase